MLNFLAPKVLFLLLLLLPLYVLLRRWRSLRSERAALFGVTLTTTTPLLLPLMVTALLIIALARPYVGFEQISRKAQGRDIVLIIDISLSMLAKDVPPNRLTFAKRKAIDIVRYLTARSPGDRLGIVLFSGDSYLYCPLTSDYGVITTFVETIQPELITVPGSALRRALQVTAESFRRVDAAFPKVILLTDGEERSLDAIRAAELLNAPISIIGVGTTTGTPIELGNGSMLRNRQGELVMTALQEESLKTIAAHSHGVYTGGTVDDRDIETALQVGKGDAHEAPTESSVTVYNEIGPRLLLIPLALAMLQMFLRRKALLFSLALITVSRTATADTLQEARDAYERRDFEAAAKLYDEARAAGDATPEALNGLARALHMSGKYEEAEKLFQSLAAAARNPREEFDATYNRGTSALFGKAYDRAIDAYTRALQIKPDDVPTKFNLELARKRKSESAPPSPTPTPTPSPSPKPSPSPSPPAPPSPTPEPSPSGEPSPSPSPGDSPQSSPTPNPSASGSPTPGPSGATPSPTPGDGDAPAPSPNPTTAPTALPSPQDTRPLSEREAQELLESLPESPILLFRKGGKPPDPDQTW